MFAGYWPDGDGGPDELGWFPTGDIGYLLDGELFLVDRARELIIVNGFNVYPAEVEDAIAELRRGGVGGCRWPGLAGVLASRLWHSSRERV